MVIRVGFKSNMTGVLLRRHIDTYREDEMAE